MPHDVPVQAEAQQPLAISNNEGGILVLPQLQHGWQVLRVESYASLVRLYNWASIPCPPRQGPVLYGAVAVKRILLWPGGRNAATHLPAATATAMTTAFIPPSSGPVPASSRNVAITCDPTPVPAAIDSTVLRTVSMFTPHLCSVGPANPGAVEALTRVVVVLPQHQQQEQDPSTLSNVCIPSKTLVRFDHSSGTAKAAAALLPETSRCTLRRRLNIHPSPPTISGGKIATLDDGDPSRGSASPIWSYLLASSPLEVRLFAFHVCHIRIS